MLEADTTVPLQTLIAERIPQGILVVRVSDGAILYANNEEPFHKITQSLMQFDTWNGEIQSQKKDGTHFYCQVSVSSVELPPHGKVRIAVYVDITPHKDLEEQLTLTAEQLAHSNSELEQFAHIVSHELQEPLRSVISFLQLLEARYKNQLDDKADHFIERTVEGAKRMQALIEALLNYAKLTGEAEHFEVVDGLDILSKALLSLEAATANSGAVITHDPLPKTWGVPTHLEQVFKNLIGNAIKFTSPLGTIPKIHVGVSRNGEEWIFSVNDNGIGIEPEFFSRIFGIFERLNTHSKYPGTGIGLAICKKIVEQHGGRIWVDSTLGRGSTFYFSIPMQESINDKS